MITIHTDQGSYQVPDNIYTIAIHTPKSMHDFEKAHNATIRHTLRQGKNIIKGLMPLGQATTENETHISTVNYFAAVGSYIEL